MPSIKTLLLAWLLAIFALSIVVFTVKKSKPIQDAEFYAKQNPHCNTVKVHSNKNSLVECFWNFESFEELLGIEDSLYASMAKFIGERFPNEFPLRIHHIFSIPGMETDSVGIYGNSIIIAKSKNLPWHNKNNGCKFPGPCPVPPLRTIVAGKDSIYAINAILPGRVIKIEQNELYSITIYHGENIYSKTSGILELNDYVQLGKNIVPDSILGILPPKKNKYWLEVTQNGKRIGLPQATPL
ncbi:MAG: hypothetical protein LBC85_10690 [Fibromonadaceae bacterium]|jgi:hypothetical protein|nr:hypothetical protein [Fibromonadaceae bacterium]